MSINFLTGQSIDGNLSVLGGSITLGGISGRIQGVVTVLSGSDATSKSYVDNAVSGVSSGVTSVATTNGITGGTITSTGTLQVDSTVVRTSGAQSIGDVKTFTSRADFSNGDGLRTNQVRTYGGQQLVLNAGESSSYATGQTNELVYINAESGLEINSSPNNWSSGWAGRKTTTINDTSGNSTFANDITVSGGDITLGGTGRIQGVDTVSASTDAANKAYVDAKSVGILTLASANGITVTGGTTANATVGVNYTAASNNLVHPATTITDLAQGESYGTYFLCANSNPGIAFGAVSKIRTGHMRLNDFGVPDGSINMSNQRIIGIDDLQFNSGVTIETSGTTNYLDVVYSSTGSGGIRIWDGDSTIQGYLFGDGGATSSFGLLHGSGSWAVRCLENSYVELRNNNAVKLTTSTTGVTVTGDLIVTNVISTGYVGQNTQQTRDKLRVWSGSTYTMGFKSGYTFGGLGGNGTATPDYAMSFQMSNTTNRGWWWGDSSHTDAQGSMALTTDGRLNVATAMSVGYGETNTTSPGSSGSNYVLNVRGNLGSFFHSLQSPALVVQGGANSNDVQTWLNISGQTLTSLSSTGNFYNAGNISAGTTDTTARLNASSYGKAASFYSAYDVTLTVRGGYTSTNQNIQDWQNENGSLVSKIGYDGSMGINTGTTTLSSKLTVVAPITSGGNGVDFQINGGSGYGMNTLQVEIPAYGTGIRIVSTSSSNVDNQAMTFINHVSTAVGSIYLNTSSTSYNTTSDYRLKENREDISDAIERVKELRPVKFNWIKEPGESKVDGFYAHELAEVVPEAVTGEKDALDWEGNPEYQAIDQSKIVPLLTAALQQAIDKIEALEVRILTLENK